MKTASRPLRVVLWAVQILLFLVFTGTGLWKLLTPIPQLAAMIPWAGEVPAPFLHATAVLDLLGGIGILLPAVTRIAPGLTLLAALGCAALQVGAVVFHLSRGEATDTPFNVLLAALALFVAWGRRRTDSTSKVSLT
ncbi:DoxX family protein [Pseudonocardia sp. DSM 110487]|uniref:DoxX family protein n=1 Tax=Pseudonocardia sp. DSM 110487 TaxID=2865833 RepID=UPI001C699F9D|nr:DoxX family protein [Pseudonocardia sp. DSM 110487]QYN37756.1 DoxX family protein [Pseudonocardia sp. DSM 110487]